MDAIITQEFIDKNYVSEFDIPKITFKGLPYKVVKSENKYWVLTQKLLEDVITKMSVSSMMNVQYCITKDLRTKDTIGFVDLSTAFPAFSVVTDLFKRYGIILRRLNFGYSPLSNTLYISPKLNRDITRMSSDVVSTIVVALIQIWKIVSSKTVLVLEKEAFGSEIKLVADPSFHFADLLEPMTPRTVTIKNNDTIDVSGIVYYTNAFCTFPKPIRPPMSYALMKFKKGAVEGFISTIAFGSKKYVVLIEQKGISTNFELCTMELGQESVSNFLVSCYDRGTQNPYIRTANMDILLNGAEITVFDYDSAEDCISENWMLNYLKAGVSAGIIGAMPTASDLTFLKDAGAVISKGVGYVDAESIKAEYKDDEYAQELYKQVQPHYDEFELGSLDNNLAGFANGALYAMAFVGESGTGKSTAARVIPYRCGMPFVSVNFSVNIEEADLFGSMFPNNEKSKPEDPEFVWRDGVLTKAIRNGYVAILEELNFARPGVLGKLNSLLDENRQMDLANGEVLKAHKNFRIIATCNIAYEGTNRFNKALINRFDDVTVFHDLEQEDAIAVIKKRTKYADTAKIQKIYRVYADLKKYAKENNIQCVVSMRQLLNLFTIGKYYKNAEDAVRRIMLNGAFLEDPEYQEVFEQTVLPAYDLTKLKI